MRWYMVTPECSSGMQDLKTIPDVYEAGRILPPGSIVPESWKGARAVQDLYMPKNYLVPYEPTEADYPLLYMIWPNERPRAYKVADVENPAISDNAWFEVLAPDAKRNMSGIPYGLSALRDVAGVCKAGQMATVGGIVPSAFFTGLNIFQLEQIQQTGVISNDWLDGYRHEQKVEYLRFLARPLIRRAYPTKTEKQALYEKFPAMNPANVTNVTQEIKTDEKPAPRRKTRKDK